MEIQVAQGVDLPAVQSKIYEVRGRKVMLDFDLAGLYGVETRTLNQAVKRNMKRFPPDFMLQLAPAEWEAMSSQFVMTSRRKRPKSSPPYAFTELGVAMLSSVLSSETAVQVNMDIMRAFVALRRYALGYAELKRQLDDFMATTNMQLSEVYQALAALAEQKREAEKPRKPIGFQRYGGSL
ncbi:MAG: ORF6N domain-containing protein [Prevotellaceae bacterium]|jgi:hypothetical protein|nr:ORF6N domain-containing protein [Prevotellaceae bacterium]